MTSHVFIVQLADQVERMFGTGAIFALRLDGCRLDGERQLVLDTHDQVMAELRRRGHRVRSNTFIDEIDGEVITSRIVTGPGWQPDEWY